MATAFLTRRCASAPLVGLALFSLAAAGLATGCEREGCVGGEEGCIVSSPCQNLTFTGCREAALDVHVIQVGEVVPGGVAALGAPGDILITNGRVSAVIEAIDNRNYIAISGGMVLDLSTVGDDNDTLTHLEHVTGLLPGDAVNYKTLRLIEEDGAVGVQVEGHLVADERQRVYTRYELRPCDPGLRIRTEMVNGSSDDAVWMMGDGYYWFSRSNQPFAPVATRGFMHPAFGLSTVDSVITSMPYFAASTPTTPPSSMAEFACNVPAMEGLHSNEISLVGLPREVVGERDYRILERFVAVANGRGVAPAVDIALAAREQMFGEPNTTVSGTVSIPSGPGSVDDENRASLHFFQGRLEDPEATRIPITQAVANADGTFSARIPTSAQYVLEVMAFGRVVETRTFSVEDEPVTLAPVVMPPVGGLTLSVTKDGALADAQVFLRPADDDTQEAVAGRYNKIIASGSLCAPLLGNPWTQSPACDRVLTSDPVTFAVPPGNYDLYATAGLEATIAHRRVSVVAGAAQSVTLNLTSLVVAPSDTLSADFHVHGGKSFDTQIPEEARVRSFLASGLDVIAATDHEVIWDYAETMDALGANDRMHLMTGLETAGEVLFKFNPDVSFPQTVGHYIFWPLPFRPDLPRNGAPDDEQLEPGELFTRMAASGLQREGVIQLNHPMSPGAFARAFGFAEAIGLKFNEPLPLSDDGTGPGLFARRPEGALFSNSDYHAQEVMNGTQNDSFFEARAFWFYLLNQGIFRSATANSDSHTLVDNIVGVPRNIVFSSSTVGDFDENEFNQAVKRGQMFGTNGPMLDARVVDASGALHRPRIGLISRTDGPLQLRMLLRAAPWVPVDEIRIYINGTLARTISDLTTPTDPFGTVGLVRYNAELSLNDLLPSNLSTDAWVVVEAGSRLQTVGDLNCDGIPDTSDNNGDGTVDWRDVDRNGDGAIDADDDLAERPEPCSGGSGPIARAAQPSRDDVARYPFAVVTPGGYPLMFTNPFILDLNQDGVFDPPGIDVAGAEVTP